MAIVLPEKDPKETVVITLDATSELESSETLLAITNVTTTVSRGVDLAPAIITSNQINTIQLSVSTPAGLITISPNNCVQLVASGGIDRCWYLLSVTCTTSNPNKVLTLKATLPISSN